MCNSQHITPPNYMPSKLIANSHTSHMTCQRIELQSCTRHKLKKLNQDIILIKAQDMQNQYEINENHLISTATMRQMDVFDPNGMPRRCAGQDMKLVCDTMHASCVFPSTFGSCICTSKCTDQNMGPAAPSAKYGFENTLPKLCSQDHQVCESDDHATRSDRLSSWRTANPGYHHQFSHWWESELPFLQQQKDHPNTMVN